MMAIICRPMWSLTFFSLSIYPSILTPRPLFLSLSHPLVSPSLSSMMTVFEIIIEFVFLQQVNIREIKDI